MFGYTSLVSLILLAASLYALGRAYGWSNVVSLGVAGGSVFGSVALLVVLFTTRHVSPFGQEFLGGLLLIGLMVLVFALSMSVWRKVRRLEKAPRQI